uniref:Uncharacterized protein n=1 Tax=Chrysotila carterae TaxID=13221 RepID=A0A7S4BBL8_CHRCT|mmetsp:Transcript_59756/g.129508  ORF Transcript_59756/g.129508 Transcript_59756/m.129508 type:complete len:387 (+) Transcript_59756:111-1271(+)
MLGHLRHRRHFRRRQQGMNDPDNVDGSRGGRTLSQKKSLANKRHFQVPVGHAARLDPDFAASVVLVCITAFYTPDRKRQNSLAHTVSVVQSWAFNMTQTVIFTQDAPALRQGLIKNSAPMKHVGVVEPAGIRTGSLGSPDYALAWAHRDVMEQNASAYNFFVYLEDDIELTWPKLVGWWHDEQLLQLFNKRHPEQPPMHRGFFEYEHRGKGVSEDGELPLMVTVDPGACKVNFTAHKCRIAVRSIEGEKDNRRRFIGLPNPRSGSWVMDQARLQRFIKSAHWRPQADGQLAGVPWDARATAAAADAWMGFTQQTRGAWRFPTYPVGLGTHCVNAMVVPYHTPRKKGHLLDAIAGLHHMITAKQSKVNKSKGHCMVRNVPANQAALV